MQRKKCLPILAVLMLMAALLSSCRKLPQAVSSGQLGFSVDTLLFDTVFTDRGTSTRSVKIINKESQRIRISNLRLFRGEHSPYFLNVNGKSGKVLNDIYVEANDSIWVFASVFIDPGNQDEPFVVEDRLVAQVGTDEYNLPILAYGQDAIYITDSVLSSQTWTKDKPYVIIHNALVDEGELLSIEAGTRVYMHGDSRLYVLGSLQINGTKEDSVVFQGDRIDRRIYFDESGEDFANGARGEWGGLYFAQTSYNNRINYAYFKNGGASTYLGSSPVLDATIQVDPDTLLNGQPKLTITNSVIRNSAGYGIFAYNGSIKAENCLIFASAKENVALVLGGNYEFIGCTLANFTSRLSTPTQQFYGVVALNFYATGNNQYLAAPLTANFSNCIIYGNMANEFFANKVDDVSASVTLNHCLLKQNEALPAWVSANSNLFNESPLFVNTESNYLNIAADDYHLDEGSPARGRGVFLPGMLSNDIEGTPRGNPPSIGCYE